jgi:large subunit ribosomal protein L9
MKVILLKDVKGVGLAHEAVTMADGHALNYLLPKKLAVLATPSAEREAETRRKQAQDRSALDNALLAQNIAALADARITLKMKANEKGHLYDAIGEREIRAAAKEQARIDIPEGAVRLEKPLKELGVFDVPVAVGDIFGKFSITVEAES